MEPCSLGPVGEKRKLLIIGSKYDGVGFFVLFFMFVILCVYRKIHLYFVTRVSSKLDKLAACTFLLQRKVVLFFLF